LGAPYALHAINVRKRNPEFLTINPNGKIP
jgi:glutathione S-transferase